MLQSQSSTGPSRTIGLIKSTSSPSADCIARASILPEGCNKGVPRVFYIIIQFSVLNDLFEKTVIYTVNVSTTLFCLKQFFYCLKSGCGKNLIRTWLVKEINKLFELNKKKHYANDIVISTKCIRKCLELAKKYSTHK